MVRRSVRKIACLLCAGMMLLALGPARAEEQIVGEETGEEQNARAIDFEALKRRNPDIYAWLEIPGTVIDYPVLQSAREENPEQEYYLHYDADRQESVYGAVFSQDYNKKDFADFITVLYGHNMKDYTMFGSLSLFEEPGVMERNKKIYIYLPEATLEYEIFAAYPVDAFHLLSGFDLESGKDCRDYLQKVKRQARNARVFDHELFDGINEDSHILALSTCYHGDPTQRFLVQAVLHEEGAGWTERAIELGLRARAPKPHYQIIKPKYRKQYSRKAQP